MRFQIQINEFVNYCTKLFPHNFISTIYVLRFFLLCEVQSFHHEISFHSYANKANFYMNSFVLSLAFIMRLTSTRKWPGLQSARQSSTLQKSS